MTDIIERAEMIDHDLNTWSRIQRKIDMWPKLLAALKDARAQRYNASALSESVITHVLADIDQVCNEDQWPLRQRLEVIQKICDGSEYAHD